MVQLEAFPIQFCKSIRSNWRRRRYQNLDGPEAERKTGKIVKLGGTQQHRWRRTWKVRPSIRLHLKLLSPLRLLARLRDAYINMMLSLAGKSNGLSGYTAPEALWGKRVPKARPVHEAAGDFERRLVAEIYKSLAASRQLIITSS